MMLNDERPRLLEPDMPPEPRWTTTELVLAGLMAIAGISAAILYGTAFL